MNIAALTRSYLKLQGVHVDRHEAHFFLSAHPYSHTLLALSNYLTSKGFKNMIVSLPFHVMSQLPLPAIVRGRDPNRYGLITAVKEDWVEVASNNTKKRYGQTEYQKIWSEAVLIGENKNRPFTAFTPKFFGQRPVYFFYGFLLITSVYKAIVDFNMSHIYLWALCLAGIYFSVLAKFRAYQMHTLGLQLFCRANAPQRCALIEDGVDNRILGVFPLSSASLFYFLLLFFHTVLSSSAYSLWPWLSVLGLPIVAKAWIEQFRSRSFCNICMAISATYAATIIVLWTHAIHFPELTSIALLLGLVVCLGLFLQLFDYTLENNKGYNDLLSRKVRTTTNSKVFLDGLLSRRNPLKIPADLPCIPLLRPTKIESHLQVILSMECAACKRMLEQVIRLSEFLDHTRIDIYIHPKHVHYDYHGLMLYSAPQLLDRYTELKLCETALLEDEYFKRYNAWPAGEALDKFPVLVLNGIVLDTVFSADDLLFSLR